MRLASPGRILVFNAGSSTLKVSLFLRADPLRLVATGTVSRVGGDSVLVLMVGDETVTSPAEAPDHGAAAGVLTDALRRAHLLVDTRGLVIGHRVVHGGSMSDHCLLDDETLVLVGEASSLAPLHNPPALAVIDYARSEFGAEVPMVAAFDTALFAGLPDRSRLYAVDSNLAERHSIRRYGFHGLAHSHMFDAAVDSLGLDRDRARVITLQLGNGCSAAAFSGGTAVDTSMGMTPLEGLIMGTRSGDLDPALVGIMVEAEGIAADEAIDLLNHRSGLLGVSGLSSDMAELAAAEAEGHEGASLAREMFAYRVRKYIGAYVAALGGIDALVFGGGIGENDEGIRERITDGLGAVGIGEGAAPILVVPVDEMSVIARAVALLVG